MLIVTRRTGERIRIGGIVITVVRTRRGDVRLGVESPPPGVAVERLPAVESAPPAEPSRRPCGVMQPAGSLPAGDTGTVSPPRVTPGLPPAAEAEGKCNRREEGGSHPGLERAIDLFDALVSSRKRSRRGDP